jgi:hypothetical protein
VTAILADAGYLAATVGLAVAITGAWIPKPTPPGGPE